MRFMFVCIILLAMSVNMGTVMAQQVPVPQPSVKPVKARDVAKINSNLAIVNNAFENYNSYKTKFRVEGNRLIWKNEYTEVSANIEDIIFFADYTNKWLSFKCRNGKCMEGTSFPEEYSMALTDEAGNIAPSIEAVIHALNTIRGEILRK